MQARRPTYYLYPDLAEILERYRPGYIAALLERADLCLIDSGDERSQPARRADDKADLAATTKED